MRLPRKRNADGKDQHEQAMNDLEQKDAEIEVLLASADDLVCKLQATAERVAGSLRAAGKGS